ncbi:hypothetical protein ABIA30_004813 [Mycobacterium sp. MAA66]|uniref:MspA family porin n=1 Tax=Mycobacterium sp. MAA66 TaxID=3156297 RepID=UPI003518D87D
MKYRPLRLGVTATAAITLMAATIHIPAVATAEPINMAPQVYDKVSADGWHLDIKIHDEVINSVPNLAAAANSREAFVTATATATAVGGANPIQDSLFILGYQLGCQSDVSAGLVMGGTGGVSGSASIPAGVGGTIGAAGFLETILQPGVITDLPMTNMALNPGGASTLSIDNLHIKADACGGDVSIRSYAYLRISTVANHTSYAIYGDPIKI